MASIDCFIAIPCAELGYARFWQMLHTVRGYGSHVERGLWSARSGSYIHDTHTEMVKNALKFDNWDRLLFLEHDHDFPNDLLEKHESYTEPIVSGLYVWRDVQHPLPVFYNWDASRKNALHPPVERVKEMLDNPGLHEVDVVPMGCTSIRRDVLEQWPNDVPMFFSPTNPATGTTMTDDVWFCRQAQDQGWQAYVDTSLHCTHYSLLPIDVRFFVSWFNSRK